VETSAISYRVADFLKQHPPFNVIDEGDLLDLAAGGRVKFHEAHEYILWQGEPHRFQIFVIQQGTVSLWDEAGGQAELRDVRGPGDLLGIERFNGAKACLHSARSTSDVVIYGFPADDFERLVLKYAQARQYVLAHGSVVADYQPTGAWRDPQALFVHDLVARRKVSACGVGDTIQEAARLLTTGAGALAVVSPEHGVSAVLTPKDFVRWIASGGRDPQQPVATLVSEPPRAVALGASVVEGALAMGAAPTSALLITADGTPSGALHGVVTPRDLLPVFGDEPVSILEDVRLATGSAQLRELNRRARALVSQYLTKAASVDWLSHFARLIDVAVVKRLIAFSELEEFSACWSFCGSSGRGESLTSLIPHIVVIVEATEDRERVLAAYERVMQWLGDCDYLPRLNLPFDPPFYVATVDEWKQRYLDWMRDPIRQQMYRARSLFDLRSIHGPARLWQEIQTAVGDAVDGDFLHVLANDCLTSLPPLTFFQDAVVDESGEQASVFRLEQTALRPLVDVGRVFGMAAKQVIGSSTLERFAVARTLLPEREAIFREASDTFRIVLWQQGRVGIAEGTRGAELPPALLSRHDRHILKSGFRSIHRLLEFTADPTWLEHL
jgi:CBS domain-containing protein